MQKLGVTAILVLGLTFVSVKATAYDRVSILREMEPRIASCLRRRDTGHTIFHGCVDWHSAVHAHWALFRISRVLGVTSALTREAEQSLAPDKLRFEERAVVGTTTFENPYGRAWFLRLAIDFERWADANHESQPARLRPLAESVAASILTHFSTHPVTPETPEYDNASWALYQVHSYYAFIQDNASLQIVQGIIETKFLLPAPNLTFAETSRGFFSLFGNWAYLVAKTQPSAILEAFQRQHPVAPIHTQWLYPFTTAHSLGLTWSRAWAFSALGRTVMSQRAREIYAYAFKRHVEHGMNNHARFKNDYQAYGHWIPQFAVYALTEAYD